MLLWNNFTFSCNSYQVTSLASYQGNVINSVEFSEATSVQRRTFTLNKLSRNWFQSSSQIKSSDCTCVLGFAILRRETIEKCAPKAEILDLFERESNTIHTRTRHLNINLLNFRSNCGIQSNSQSLTEKDQNVNYFVVTNTEIEFDCQSLQLNS